RFKLEETPLKPLSTVPFRRDPDFVDHGTLLEQIDKKATVPGSRTVLVGLGGVGKSQLAIEYSYRVRVRSPEAWVLWIHASNEARFEKGCRHNAELLGIPGYQDLKTNLYQLLRDWLLKTERRWLLVFDNLDDDDFLRCNSQPTPDNNLLLPIWEYFPQSLQGSILITSRSKRVALDIVEDNDIIRVEPMDKSRATDLLKTKLGNMEIERDKHDTLSDLSKELDFMPLAMAQAAAYIRRRVPFLSVEQYLSKFRGSDHQQVARLLVEHEGMNLRRDHEAKNSILMTWQISLDHIQQVCPAAADLLALMSFFDRQGIPDFMLRRSQGVLTNSQAGSRLHEDQAFDNGDPSEITYKHGAANQYEASLCTGFILRKVENH
ncbi:uncharacterized protein N7496_002612, partial [Penicillium cataractarum]